MHTTAARPLAVMLTTLAVATPAHAADFSVDEDTQLSIYGTLEPKIITETDANGDDSTELADEDSTLGFRAEHGLRADLVAFGQVELELSSDEPDSGFGGQDSAFAGLEGGFGKVKAGHFDNVYEDLIIDATEVAEDAEITDEAVASEDNMIAYYSPSFGGFHFRTQVRIQGQSELEDNTALNDANNEVGIAAAGGYTGERFGVYAGFDDRGAEVVADRDANGTQVGDKISDSETYGVAATVEAPTPPLTTPRAPGRPRLANSVVDAVQVRLLLFVTTTETSGLSAAAYTFTLPSPRGGHRIDHLDRFVGFRVRWCRVFRSEVSTRSASNEPGATTGNPADPWNGITKRSRPGITSQLLLVRLEYTPPCPTRKRRSPNPRRARYVGCKRA